MRFPHNIKIVLMAAAAMLLLGGVATRARAEALPAGAKGFAGMIAGEVVSVTDGQLVLKVSEVAKTWKHSKAEDASSLVGKQVTVQGAKDAAAVAKYIASLKAGDKVSIDVRNIEGDTLTLVELTKEQRERVK